MEKAFDAVAWMRKRRAEIDEEDERLTWEEKSRKTLEILEADPLWQRVRSRVVERRPDPRAGSFVEKR